MGAHVHAIGVSHRAVWGISTICTNEIQNAPFLNVAGTAHTAATRARELIRLRRIAEDLDEGIQEALLERCGDREVAIDGDDLDLTLALKLLAHRNLFDRAFEASLVASQWPSNTQ